MVYGNFCAAKRARCSLFKASGWRGIDNGSYLRAAFFFFIYTSQHGLGDVTEVKGLANFLPCRLKQCGSSNLLLLLLVLLRLLLLLLLLL